MSERGEVFTCPKCGAQWCRIVRPGPVRKFCSPSCNRAYQRGLKRGLKRGDSRHGTSSGYQLWGCRCKRCKAAVNLAVNGEPTMTQAKRQARRDKVRSLASSGVPHEVIAKKVGLSVSYVGLIAGGWYE